MKDIILSYLDRKPVLAPGELEEKIRASAPVLEAVVAGEAQYQDSLGSVSYTHLGLAFPGPAGANGGSI